VGQVSNLQADLAIGPLRWHDRHLVFLRLCCFEGEIVKRLVLCVALTLMSVLVDIGYLPANRCSRLFPILCALLSQRAKPVGETRAGPIANRPAGN
jgi:hypothetical protein